MPVDERTAGSDPLVGRILDGRFKVAERIGAGGMGRVYRAVQAPLGREVALKVVIPNYSEGSDPQFYKRFFLEASVTSKLSHPNIITIYDYGKTDDGLVYIAMEYLQGRTLSDLVSKDGPLPPERAVHIAAQIARALREAHGKMVMHRDLKPANVMLLKHGEDDGFVKVLDFGLVKFFGAHRAASPDMEDLTIEGSFVGSPKFMAPEQASKTADHRADIYSLGVLLYYMLDGKAPFRGETVAETIVMHIQDPVPHLASAPPELAAIVTRMMAKRPADRFQSMAEVLEALRHFSSGDASGRHTGPILIRPYSGQMPPPLPPKRAETSGVRAPPPPPAAPIRSRARMLAIASGTVVGMALATAAALWMLRQEQAPEPRLAAPAPAQPRAPLPRPAPVAAAQPAREVLFRVQSEPAGAQVLDPGGELLGQTPLELSRPLSGESVTVKLRLGLQGYEIQDVEDTSAGEERSLNVKLRKLDLKKPPPPRPALKPGYKDDPY